MLGSQDAEQTAADVADQQARIGRLARAVYQGGGAWGTCRCCSTPARRRPRRADRLAADRGVLAALRAGRPRDGQDVVRGQDQDLEAVRDEVAAADEQAQKDLRAVTALADQARVAEAQVAGLVAARKAALAAAAAAQARRTSPTPTWSASRTQLQGQLADQARSAARARRQPATAPPSRRGRAPSPGRPTARSPRRSACGCTRSPASTSCTPAPTSASPAAPRCTSPGQAPSSRPAGTAPTAGAPSCRTATSTASCSRRPTTTRSHLEVSVGDQVAAVR